MGGRSRNISVRVESLRITEAAHREEQNRLEGGEKLTKQSALATDGQRRYGGRLKDKEEKNGESEFTNVSVEPTKGKVLLVSAYIRQIYTVHCKSAPAV